MPRYLFIYQLFWTQACPEGMCTNETQVPCEVPSLSNPTTRKGWPHHRGLEMHSIILGELESFRNYKGLIITRQNFRYYARKWDIFSDSSLHRIFQSENFRFRFFYKNSSTGNWNVKIKLQKIVGNLLDKLLKLCMNGTAGDVEIFRRSQVIENRGQYLLLRTDIFNHREQSLVAADISLLCLSTAKKRDFQITVLSNNSFLSSAEKGKAVYLRYYFDQDVGEVRRTTWFFAG